jgi:hypothetical protein
LERCGYGEAMRLLDAGPPTVVALTGGSHGRLNCERTTCALVLYMRRTALLDPLGTLEGEMRASSALGRGSLIR